jgi:ankyrin repeat protein
MSKQFWSAVSDYVQTMFYNSNTKKEIIRQMYKNGVSYGVFDGISYGVSGCDILNEIHDNIVLKQYWFDNMCSSGNLELVHLFLTMGEFESTFTCTDAFCEASENGHIAIVDRLLQESLVDPSVRNNVSIQKASENGHIAVVERLLQEPSVDPFTNLNYAFRMACKNGNVEIVDILLQDDRVDPNYCNFFYKSALCEACDHGHISIVDRLLQEKDVDPSIDTNCAIRLASLNGFANIVDMLLLTGRVDPSDQHNYAIKHAKYHGHTDVINRLLQDPRTDTSARSATFNDLFMIDSMNDRL